MIHNIKSLLLMGALLFVNAINASYERGDWIKLGKEFYFVLERWHYTLDNGRADLYPVSEDDRPKILDYCPRMKSLDDELSTAKPIAIAEFEVVHALGDDRVQAAKKEISHILSSKYSLSDEDILLLMSNNDLMEEQVMDEAIRRTGREDIGFEIVYEFPKIEVTFKIQRDKKPEKQLFEFWKSVRVPKDPDELEDSEDHFLQVDVIPAEHPALQFNDDDQDKSILIYGFANGLRVGGVIEGFYPPRSALIDKNSQVRKWSDVRHPYKVITHSFTVSMLYNRVNQEAAIVELVKILNYALRKDGHYMEVSSGFGASSKNKKLSLPKGRRSANGYRAYKAPAAVHLYRYLKRKGRLEGAIVPSWLFDDGWIR